MLVVWRHKLGPWLLAVRAYLRLEVRVQLDAVPLQVLVQRVGAQHARDLDELVVVVVAVEERLLCKG